MPLGLFRSRAFTTINLATFFIYGGLYVMFSYQGIVLQGVLGYTALGAGAVGPAGRHLPRHAVDADRHDRPGRQSGRGRFLTLGPALMAAGLLWFTRLPASSDAVARQPRAARHRWSRRVGVSSTSCRRSCCSGIGIACVVAPLTNTLMGSIPERFSGSRLGHQQRDRAGRPAAARGADLRRDQRDVLRAAWRARPRPRPDLGRGPRRRSRR